MSYLSILSIGLLSNLNYLFRTYRQSRNALLVVATIYLINKSFVPKETLRRNKKIEVLHNKQLNMSYSNISAIN